MTSANTSPNADSGRKPLVGIIMGSQSDWPTMKHGADVLEALGVPFEVRIVSAHRTPQRLYDFASGARERGLKVVEDCAQAHGARYRGRPVGSIGDVGAWSFCQDKIMTTGGEGGMVATDDETLWRRMWEHKDHGKSWEAVYEREHPPGYRWLHESFGTNWRMNEIQGVIGRLQLAEMPRWHAARSANAHRIWDACRAMPWLRVPRVPDDVEHGAYRAFAFVRSAALPAGWDRDRIVDAIAAEGVPCASRGSAEIYLERAFDGTGFRPPERLPTARELAETAVAFLVHPTLTDLEIEATCRAIGAVGARIEAERGGGAGSVRGASAC